MGVISVKEFNPHVVDTRWVRVQTFNGFISLFFVTTIHVVDFYNKTPRLRGQFSFWDLCLTTEINAPVGSIEVVHGASSDFIRLNPLQVDTDREDGR